ncbi:MAG: hypothetical protein EOP00_00125 [Pedobacter sp.]|nr:MAG: hypothetical protein EOP00_00125 [Pedobacter sp.]
MIKLKICLAKTVLIFYAIITPFIVYGSLYNLIKGVIIQENPSVYVGAFSLFGFILLPLLLISTYRQNICVIAVDKVKVGKQEFTVNDYSFSIAEKHLAFKDRPIFMPFKKTYYMLVVKNTTTNQIVLENDLNIFNKDLLKLRQALQNLN